mgnify:FL=1|jgi:hypothetical protein
MNNYFAEGNVIKFDHQNGKIEVIAFAATHKKAKEIAKALNKQDNEE